MRLNRAALAAACLIGCAVLMASGSVVTARKTTLSVWFPLYGGNLKTGFDEIVRQFTRQYPEIDVKVLGVDVGGEKFLTAMAGGAPPDVIFPDGPQVVQWAYKNLLTPLDTYMKNSKVSSEAFWGPSYKQNLWKGKPYALPWISDSVAALVYNKTVFNEAGLGRAPANLVELEAFAHKVTKADSQGAYTRFGFQPWGGPDGADFNSMYTFGWAFGGDFYDEKASKVMLDSPKMVDALEWMNSYTQHFGYPAMTKFWSKYTNWSSPDPLLNGRLAMSYRLSIVLKDIELAKKSLTDFGFDYVTGPTGERSAWIGGWCVALPANGKHRDDAWKFVRWLCADPQGAMSTYKATAFLPSIKAAECFTRPEAKLKPFIDILDIATHFRPTTPAMPVMNSELNRLMPLVFSGKKTPQQALSEATTRSQKELDRMLAKRK